MRRKSVFSWAFAFTIFGIGVGVGPAMMGLSSWNGGLSLIVIGVAVLLYKIYEEWWPGRLVSGPLNVYVDTVIAVWSDGKGGDDIIGDGPLAPAYLVELLEVQVTNRSQESMTLDCEVELGLTEQSVLAGRKLRVYELPAVGVPSSYVTIPARQTITFSKTFYLNRRDFEAGDIWTWVALAQDSKLAISWLVGDRGKVNAHQFMRDLASRLVVRTQLTTDGNNFYHAAVEAAFGYNNIDYSILVKHFKTSGHGPAGRYSPGECTGVTKIAVLGRPNEKAASTSHVERLNLTLRMQNRRFTRLTNGFSKKAENHAAMVDILFCFYNWCRPHHTLTQAANGIHTTPAMANGLTSRVWAVEDLVSILDENEAS